MKNSTVYKARWYAVYVLPRLEQKVHERIEDMGVESFLPTKIVIKKWSDRKKKVRQPLFPNYVFVKTSLQERFQLFGITGLVKFITFEGKPVEIPEKSIEAIKQLVELSDDISSDSYMGNIGDKVTVQNGQFAGIEGVITQLNGKNRLVIQIKALRQSISVNVSTEDISLPVSA